MKRKKQHNHLGFILVTVLAIAGVGLYFSHLTRRASTSAVTQPDTDNQSKYNLAPIPTITPTPTPRPLTFAELNERYGPCATVPTLMYHHIQTKDAAAAKNQTGLTVETNVFEAQMQYLKDHSYQVISIQQLNDFFDAGTKLPIRAVLLTIDDAYADFYTDAYPILKNFSYHATMFVPTGLVDNPDYLTWNQIDEMHGSGLVYFGNHTWSHKNMASSLSVDKQEMQTADTQLSEHGLNPLKVFAYPYGLENNNALVNLNELKYTLAFTTRPGRVLCKQQRLSLPRVRIGNGSLSSYGL